jgi:hypothetical protein
MSRRRPTAERRDYRSTPTRIRTWNAWFEARHDVRFTIEAKSPRRKARESNPHLPSGRTVLAGRPGEPVSGYLPLVIPDGLEPSLTGCEPAVVAAGPRDQVKWRMENSEWRMPDPRLLSFSILNSPFSIPQSGRSESNRRRLPPWGL